MNNHSSHTSLRHSRQRDEILKLLRTTTSHPTADWIYQEMKKEIEATVGRINGKYGSLAWRPLVYEYRSLAFTEMVALYAASEVGLITPLRDGMNLVAKEYLA